MNRADWTGQALAVTIAEPGATLAVVRWEEAGLTKAVTRQLRDGIAAFEIACSAMPEKIFIDLMQGGTIVAYDTLYVFRPLLNGVEVIEHYKRQGFGAMLTPDDMHVTCCFSRQKMFWSVPPDEVWHEVPAGPNRMTEVFGNGACVVLRFDCGYLDLRHRLFREAGASFDWDKYSPHVTLTYEQPPINMASVMPWCGPLVFGGEKFEPVRPFTPLLKGKWGVWLADRRNPTVVDAADEVAAREAVRRKYGGKFGHISKLKQLQGKDLKLAEAGEWERNSSDE